MSQRALSAEQFASYMQPFSRLADLPEEEDEPLRSDVAPGRTREALLPRGTEELKHHPYAPELRTK